MAIKIVEVCPVYPIAGSGAEQVLPLLYFDIQWIPSPPTQTLLFYNLRCDESHFLDTIVPSLKNSLSLTLKHFLPLAGKIVFPFSAVSFPFSHYSAREEDSVTFTTAVSDSDFSLLTASTHSRDADEFHDFISPLPPAAHSSDAIKFSVAAFRVTLFPNHGVCIGVTVHHAICDGTSLVGPSGFFQAWASINKFNVDDSRLISRNLLPSYDRSNVEDAATLTTVFWNLIKESKPQVSSNHRLPTFKLRGTFEVTDLQIRAMKKILTQQTPPLARVSSHVAVCAHLWSCFVESAAAVGEEVDEDEAEFMSMYTGCRPRLSPPQPHNYFGNCVVYVLAESTHGRLRGGFVAAALAIAGAIEERVGRGREGGIVAGAEDEYLRHSELVDKGKRLIGVSGSPSFDVNSSIDYGWGRLRKYEPIYIDHSGSIFLTKSQRGGVEASLSMTDPKMNAFAAIFNKNLSITISSSL